MKLILALLTLLCITGTSSAQSLLVRDAHIVDPVDRTVRRGSVVVRNGVIVDVVASADGGMYDSVLDAQGRWLIPGLVDMHVHAFGNAAPAGALEIMGPDRVARVMLYSGVTGFLDLFSIEDQILSLRDRQRSGGVVGADIHAAGPILTSTGGHGTEYGIPTRVIDSPADARREIEALAKKRPDVVKIVYDHAGRQPTITHATLVEAIRTAKRLNLKTVVHIGTWKDAREAVEAGASAITHTFGPEEIPDDLVTLMRNNGVAHIPTLAVQSELLNIIADPRLLDRPLLARTVSKSVIDAYRDTSRFDARTKGFAAWLRRLGPSVPHSVAKLQRAGVQVLAGTDAGNLGTFQGYSLHRELELLVAAGLTTWEALAAATTRAGEFLGRKLGVRPGDEASFVLLEGSPTDTIANTQRIAAVVHHGRVIDRDALLNPPSKSWTASLIDDFSSGTFRSSIGTAWSVDTDAAFGGSSTATVEHRNGAVTVRGRLQSKPGMPALAGISLLLDSTSAVDLSKYTGVRLRITPTAGMLTLKMMTTSVSNYDYHAAVINNSKEPVTLELPFASMRQLWSAPQPWKGTDVRGLALWVSGFGAPSEYAFTVESVEIY